MKKALKVIGSILGVLIIAFIIFLLYATFNNYSPDEQIIVQESENPDKLSDWTEYDFMIWNIGYCGLDASMDFFYDGGEQVRPAKENVIQSLENVKAFLKGNDTVEFFMLQEVDVNSKRSYKLDEYKEISDALPAFNTALGLNYKVFFVPLPPTNPMGKVKSGLQTLSTFTPMETVRHSFPGNYGWPMGVFMLDRCFMVSRFSLDNGKELIVINTHNSAYDDGSLRAQQMEYLKGFLLEEYQKGNYVLVGGDWNQSPNGFKKAFEGQVFDNENYTEIPEAYPAPEWQWAFDETTPTNRRVKTSYERGVTATTLIDFYLLSPNIQLISVKTHDMDFQYSDHQPVFLKMSLLN
ncbi:MAG: hypothetical protein K9H49_16150 [Bacteroidales bacterium]|nr:hypothetical protein [Bacteroidales bacterium]MCF8405890.1 hypothetical protein [Bacteroidales bacterium]